MLLYLGFIGSHYYGIPSFGICILWIITWNYPPPRMPVAIRSIPFLVGNPYKPSFVTVTVWGGRSKGYSNDNKKLWPKESRLNDITWVHPSCLWEVKQETWWIIRWVLPLGSVGKWWCFCGPSQWPIRPGSCLSMQILEVTKKHLSNWHCWHCHRCHQSCLLLVSRVLRARSWRKNFNQVCPDVSLFDWRWTGERGGAVGQPPGDFVKKDLP